MHCHQRTSRLRIALDAKYPRIIEETEELLLGCFPHNPVGRVQAHGGTMFFVSVYSCHPAVPLSTAWSRAEAPPRHGIRALATEIGGGGARMDAFSSTAPMFTGLSPMSTSPTSSRTCPTESSLSSLRRVTELAFSHASIRTRGDFDFGPCGSTAVPASPSFSSTWGSSGDQPLHLSYAGGCGGTGIRDRPRTYCPSGRGGSNPLSRTSKPAISSGKPRCRCYPRPPTRRYRLGD